MSTKLGKRALRQAKRGFAKMGLVVSGGSSSSAKLSKLQRSLSKLEAAVRERDRQIAELEERMEDADLNALADERAKGPFVRVSLDDL